MSAAYHHPTPSPHTQTQISAQPHPPSPHTQTQISAQPHPPTPFPLVRVVYRNLALLHLRVLLLPFIVVLQNKHTTLAKIGEILTSAQPRRNAHLQGPKI